MECIHCLRILRIYCRVGLKRWGAVLPAALPHSLQRLEYSVRKPWESICRLEQITGAARQQRCNPGSWGGGGCVSWPAWVALLPHNAPRNIRCGRCCIAPESLRHHPHSGTQTTAAIRCFSVVHTLETTCLGSMHDSSARVQWVLLDHDINDRESPFRAVIEISWLYQRWASSHGHSIVNINSIH